jgi:hypothetical protein
LAEFLLFGDLVEGGDVRVTLKDDDTLGLVVTPNIKKLKFLSESETPG